MTVKTDTKAGFSTMRSMLPSLGMALLLSGCLGGSGGSESSAAPPPPGTAPGPVNHKPTISGTPPLSIREGESYEFRPSASDQDGDPLTFSVANKPSWAAFDVSTGRLAGIPPTGSAGAYGGIVISVSDGKEQSSLPAYSITVQQVSLGSATLSWIPPTQNEDGTALTDLAGYKIYYGKSGAALDQSITIESAGMTRHVIENLSPATWYFAMTAYNSRGAESARSAVASKAIS